MSNEYTETIMPAGNAILYSKWSINKYNLTIIFNNGTENDVRTLDFNEKIVCPENIEKTGYTFDGWDNKPDRMPAEDITIAAQWTANKYTVAFDVNGGNPLTESESKKQVTYDSTYEDLPTLTKTGYKFFGWAEKTTDKEVNNGTIVSIANDHTLYAIWDINKYSITFEFENGTTTTFVLSFNDSITYPNENPSKVFHEFNKWCMIDENGVKTCDVNNVPEGNLVFMPSCEVNTSLVAGTASVVFAVVVLIVIIVLLRKTKDKMKKVRVY